MSSGEAIEDVKTNSVAEFMATEYKESCSAYFKGVDLGMAYIRFFFLMNAALVAVLQLDEKVLVKTGIQQLIPYIVPLIGIFFCLMLGMIVPYYQRQLDVCAERCKQIEKKHYGENFEGSLFCRIQKENNNGDRPVTAKMYLILIPVIIGTLWLFSFPGLISYFARMVK
jgi:hypothetical protein